MAWALALALLFLLLLPARALASPADTDDPLLNPHRELDPHLDLREPHLLSGARAPLWFAISASLRRTDGETKVGAMLLIGLPLERLRAPDLHGGYVAERPPDPPAPRAPEPSPPSPPKVPAPLRIPVAVTPKDARAAVDAALRRARLLDPEKRFDALASRARGAAALPELRLRVLRSVDQGQTLSPTEYDPARITATGGTSFWMEARATWHLDRLVFADEEVALERMRHDRAAARAKLSAQVLNLLFAWQRALALANNPAASPEENLDARLRTLETEAEIDVLCDGWLSRWRAEQSP